MPSEKDKILDEIFNNDPLGLLKVKPKAKAITADERQLAKFEEINDFYEKHGREPADNKSEILEFQLYSRLKNLREDESKRQALLPADRHNLLTVAEKEINSIDDIFGDDSLGIFDEDDAGLFDFKHTPKEDTRAASDFVARRKPCKDFDKFEHLFKSVQADLKAGKRKIVDFKEGNLREGAYYVHNGVLMLLHEVKFSSEEKTVKGKRFRKDGRTRCIFENGTESNMLYRSVAKILYQNGKVVSENTDKVVEGFAEKFSNITEEDKAFGYIYVLQSRSADPTIAATENLFKIGYCKTTVEERIKNAPNEPTYLMAPVKYVAAWKCYNMKPQKFENMIHRFFGSACLDVDVVDNQGIKHSPREWFIAPYAVIKQAVQLIISGEVIKYRFDGEAGVIAGR